MTAGGDIMERRRARGHAKRQTPDELLRCLLVLNDEPVLRDLMGPEAGRILEEAAEQFATRPLGHARFEEIYLEATPLESAADAPCLLVTATGLKWDGDPEPLGFAVGTEELRILAFRVLLSLLARGLGAVGRVSSVTEAALEEAVPLMFAGARWEPTVPGERPAWLRVPGDQFSG